MCSRAEICGLVIVLLLAGLAGQAMALNSSQLDDIAAPIALYPDPIIAQMLPASTFLDQVIRADDFLRNGGDPTRIDFEDWDISVKSLAYYPSVLRKMAQDPDWTTALGQAYVRQPDALMQSIQRLRNEARTMGWLRSTNEQSVYDDGGYCRIVPAQASYIYIPQYDPRAVYTTRYSSRSNTAIVAFGVGLLMGAWLNNDVDWSQHRVYYHGWTSGGWTARTKPVIEKTNSVYIDGNRSHSQPVAVNSRITDRPVDTRSLPHYNLPVATRGAGSQAQTYKPSSQPSSNSAGRTTTKRSYSPPSTNTGGQTTTKGSYSPSSTKSTGGRSGKQKRGK